MTLLIIPSPLPPPLPSPPLTADLLIPPTFPSLASSSLSHLSSTTTSCSPVLATLSSRSAAFFRHKRQNASPNFIYTFLVGASVQLGARSPGSMAGWSVVNTFVFNADLTHRAASFLIPPASQPAMKTIQAMKPHALYTPVNIIGKLHAQHTPVKITSEPASEPSSQPCPKSTVMPKSLDPTVRRPD